MQIIETNSNRAPIVVVYGNEGRGKTSLASRFHNAVWFLLERGLPRGVTVEAVEGVDSFEGVMNGLRHLYGAEHTYQTLVVDTLDAFEPHVLEHVCAANRWRNIEQPSYGKGYVAADETWRRFLNGIGALRDKRSMAIVLTCHATIERVEDPRAPTYTAYAPKLHKRARALVMDAADIVGFLAEDLRVVTDDGGFKERTRAAAGNGRFLFVEGCPAFNAKNRFGMPTKIPIPVDFNVSELTKYWTS
jgi:AAA domain